MSATTGGLRELEQLGTGERGDRLGFRLVLRMLLRCLPLLRGVRGSLSLLLAGWAVLALLVAGLVVLVIGLWWNSVLGDGAPSAWQWVFLGLDARPAPLDADTRRAVAEALAWRGALLAPLVTGATFGLYYAQVWVLQRINQELRLRLLDRLQALSLRFHADTRVGDALYRTYQDSAVVTQLIDVLFLAPAGAVARYALGLGGVALFDPWLAVIVAALWLPTLALGRAFSRRLRAHFRQAREANAALTARIQESLAGIKVIKAYGLEGYELQRFERDSASAFEAAFRARSLFAAYRVGVFVSVAMLTLAAYWLATLPSIHAAPIFAWSLLSGSGLGLEKLVVGFGLTAWSLGAYNVFKWLFGQAAGGIDRIFQVWGVTQDVAIGLDRVFEVLDLEPEVQDRPGAREFDGVRDAIAYHDVSFRYQPDRPVIESACFEVRPGTVCAVVGPTGSGKSTLLALLVRLFDPDRGAITVDGRDLREFRVASLRRGVAIALQENVLFAATLRENVSYGMPGASDEAVRRAAYVACADEFVAALPDGYDTLLGERGARLSTGQRQRLSIARALVKDAPILILDEPTASLDAETELALLERLRAWGAGRVIFLITHRLSTIRRADQILYLAGGRIAEAGSHDALVARGGAYGALVRAETSGVPAGAAL